MTSPTLNLLERKMIRRQALEKAPAPSPGDGHGLGFAIEQLIADEVERRVGEAEERAKQQRLLDRQFNKPAPRTFEQIPPTPRTRPQEPLEMVLHYDAAGKLSWAEDSDGSKVQAIRDRAGKMIALKEVTESPVLPALAIAPKNKARQYREPEPR